MAAGQYNITIDQGADFVLSFQLKEQTTGNPVDLTGFTFRGMIRKGYSDVSPLATFVITPIDLAVGKVKVSLPNAVTELLTFDLAIYDIESVSPTGIVDRILQGRAVLSKEVTK